MKISVASALHGQTGNTTVALFIAHALAMTQKQNICLTHANFNNSVLEDAVGIEAAEDVTRSLSHVVKMLENGLLRPDNVPEYAIKVFDGLDLYSTDKVVLDRQDLSAFYDHLLTKMTAYAHVVIDVDAELTSELAKKAVALSEAIVIPITHNSAVIKASKKLKDTLMHEFHGTRKDGAVKFFYLLNHYNPEVASYRKVAADLGVPPGQLMTLRYNPEFISAMNNGKMSQLFGWALSGKSKVVNVCADMKLVCKQLLGKKYMQNTRKGVGGVV